MLPIFLCFIIAAVSLFALFLGLAWMSTRSMIPRRPLVWRDWIPQALPVAPVDDHSEPKATREWHLTFV